MFQVKVRFNCFDLISSNQSWVMFQSNSHIGFLNLTDVFFCSLGSELRWTSRFIYTLRYWCWSLTANMEQRGRNLLILQLNCRSDRRFFTLLCSLWALLPEQKLQEADVFVNPHMKALRIIFEKFWHDDQWVNNWVRTQEWSAETDEEPTGRSMFLLNTDLTLGLNSLKQWESDDRNFMETSNGYTSYNLYQYPHING